MERIKSFAKNADSFLTKSNISKKSLILWFMLLVLFITAAVFVYINYIKPQLDVMDYKANYEFNNTDDNKGNALSRKATVYLFWAEWCPNSNKESATGKRLHDTWDKITEDNKKGTWKVNNDILTFVKVNECDNDFSAHESKVTKSEIEGFPSIFVVYDDMVDDGNNNKVLQNIIYELDANPTEDTIKHFIRSALNPE